MIFTLLSIGCISMIVYVSICKKENNLLYDQCLIENKCIESIILNKTNINSPRCEPIQEHCYEYANSGPLYNYNLVLFFLVAFTIIILICACLEIVDCCYDKDFFKKIREAKEQQNIPTAREVEIA